MKNVALTISTLAVMAISPILVAGQSIGLKGGYSGASMGYDRHTSGNYVDEQDSDGSFIAVPFQYRLHKYFSLSTELGFATRNIQLNHRFLITSANGQELKTVLRAVNTHTVYMPFDVNVHAPWKGFELILSLGLQLAKNTGTTVYDNEAAINSGDGIRLPKDLRVTNAQSGWSLRGGLQYQFDRFTLLGDIRFARTFARYAQEYDFDNVPDIPSKIFTGTTGVGLMYRLRK